MSEFPSPPPPPDMTTTTNGDSADGLAKIRQGIPILDNPDPPDTGQGDSTLDGDGNYADDSMGISEQHDNNTQPTTKTTNNSTLLNPSKRPFQFTRPEEGYEVNKKSAVEMVVAGKNFHDKLSELQSKVTKLEDDKLLSDKHINTLEELIRTQQNHIDDMERKMATWKQELDVFNKRSGAVKIFSDDARDHVIRAEARVAKVESRVEEAHTLIENIDNTMKKFSTQQKSLSDARLNLAEKNLAEKFSAKIAEVKYTEAQAKLAIKKVDQLSKKVVSTTNICNETQKEVKRTKHEARSATSYARAIESKWEVRKTPRPRFSQIRAEQKNAKKGPDNQKYQVCIRVTDTEADYDINKIGSKIDEIHGKGTIKFGSRTRSGHIKMFITKKEVADSADKWIQQVGPNYSILETDKWYKGVVYGIPKEVTSDILGKEAEEKNGVKLKVYPKLMKEKSDGSIFMLCFEDAEQYLKCGNGVYVQYRKFPMKIYHKRSKEEVWAYKERKAQLELEERERTNRSKINTDAGRPSAGTFSASRDQAEALSNY